MTAVADDVWPALRVRAAGLLSGDRREQIGIEAVPPGGARYFAGRMPTPPAASLEAIGSMLMVGLLSPGR